MHDKSFASAKAFAKINLALEITGKREDGYHTLSTVMQSISLFNTVEVSENSSGQIKLCCNDLSLPTDERNTAYRAAKEFLAVAGEKASCGLDIYIQKRIPYQAGMGSASADAAGVLAAANRLFGNCLSETKLLEIAALIGADVPFCLKGGTAYASGTGEILTALPRLPQCAFLVAHPNRGMSTPQAYKSFDALASPEQPNGKKCAEAIKSGSLQNIAAACGNVFELCCDIEEVFEIKRLLVENGALTACMTGSGTAVFGIFSDETAAESAKVALENARWKSLLAYPVNCGVKTE